MNLADSLISARNEGLWKIGDHTFAIELRSFAPGHDEVSAQKYFAQLNPIPQRLESAGFSYRQPGVTAV